MFFSATTASVRTSPACSSRATPITDNVRVEDLGTWPRPLVHLSEADTILIVDCVDDGKPAGTITVYQRQDIVRQQTSLRIDSHSPALTESLMIAEFAGEQTKPGRTLRTTRHQP